MVGFIALSRDVGARCIELDHRWLRPLSLRELAELREQLAMHGMTPICSAGLTQQPGDTIEEPVRLAGAIGAPIVRLGLTPVLEARAPGGARAGRGPGRGRAGGVCRERPAARAGGGGGGAGPRARGAGEWGGESARAPRPDGAGGPGGPAPSARSPPTGGGVTRHGRLRN